VARIESLEESCEVSMWLRLLSGDSLAVSGSPGLELDEAGSSCLCSSTEVLIEDLRSLSSK